MAGGITSGGVDRPAGPRSRRPRAPRAHRGPARPYLAASALAIALAACASPPPPPLEMALGDIEVERPARSGEPNLTLAADGRAILTWLEPTASDAWALRLAIRGESGWSEPRTIRESAAFFVNWADFPSAVAMADGTIAVHWLEKVAAAPYAYHVMLALSSDDGVTWSAPFRAHDDDSPTEHGFVSMVPWNEGAALTWLDGRQMWDPDAGADHESAGDHGPPGDMSVRFRTLAPDGTLGPEVLLDARTCECCQTAMTRTADGLVAAYRDRGETEIRDIAVVRGAGETWTDPTQVSADGWKIPGCPVNGPQLSASGLDVVAAWYTGVGGEPQVYAAFSNDGGATFGSRIRVDEGVPLGRVDIERLDDGSAIVVWLEASDDRPRVLARRVRSDGGLESTVEISPTAGGRAAGFPRMVRLGDELLFAWTLPGESGGVRVRGVRLSD